MRHEMPDEGKGGGKAWFWMALCCIPMIAIAVLIILGYWGAR